MEVDHSRNCYSYRKFVHLAKHYKNQRIIGERRKVEIVNNNEHSKKEESFKVLN